jgi:transaldolase
MRILLDTANVADIQWAAAIGIIEGVTTNPSLLAQEASEQDYKLHLSEICRLVNGLVSAQVISVDADGMYREGRELARLGDHVVVEIPMIEEGLLATRRLVTDGIRVNMTLVFNAAQALFAAKAGASYVSPFIGRLDDIGADGPSVVRDIRDIFDTYRFECEILASSIRTPRHFLESARAGADAATIPPRVLRSLLLHPLTDVGLDQFLSDWSKRIAKARAGV